MAMSWSTPQGMGLSALLMAEGVVPILGERPVCRRDLGRDLAEVAELSRASNIPPENASYPESPGAETPGDGKANDTPPPVPPRHPAVPGATFSPRQLAHVTALLWAIAGAIALAAILLPHGSSVNVTGWIGMAGFAGIVSVTELLLGERLPLWPNYVTQVLSVAAISAGIEFAHKSPLAFAICSLFLLPTIFAASNYPTPLLLVYLALQSGVSAGVLLTSGVPGAIAGWVALTGTTCTVGVVVHLQQQALKVAAVTDPLTGLANRRAFEPMLAHELARCDRLGHPLCVAVIDLDGFKEVNDTLGHQEGDRVLAQLSSAWSSALRPFDILARAGGDEFVLLLPSTDTSQAVEVLGRLARASSQDFSAGVALATHGSGVEDMLHRADGACYAAKHTGRRQVAVAPDRTSHG